MSADAAILDRIDIRWSVTTRSTFDTPKGSVTARCLFVVTLGTYSGPVDVRIMADNINSHTVHEDNVRELTFEHGCPSSTEVVDILNSRGIRSDDIVEMIILDVILDDVHEIASSILASQDR